MRQSSLCRLVLTLSLLVFTTLAAAGEGPDKTPAQLLAEKDYAGVEALLKVELEKKVPSVEALTLSLQAARADGRFILASRRLDALLARSPGDVALLLQGITLDKTTGRWDRALDRTFVYVRSQNEESLELVQACEYLLSRRVDVETSAKYFRFDGTGDHGWTLGLRQLEFAYAAGDGKLLLEVSALLLAHFPREDQVRVVHERLNSAAGELLIKREDWLSLILAAPHATWTDVMVNTATQLPATSEQEKSVRMDTFLKLAEKAGDQLGAGWFEQAWNLFHQLSDLQDEGIRLALARRYLALEAVATKHGFVSYRTWCWPLFERFGAFQGKAEKFLAPEQVVACYNTLKSKCIESGQPLTAMQDSSHRVTHYVLPQEQRVAFLAANLESLGPNEVVSLADWSKETDLLGLGNRWRSGSERELLSYRIGAIPLFGRNQDKAGLLAAATDWLATYPGSFDANHFRAQFLNSPLITNQEKAALLTSTLTRGGFSSKLEWLGVEIGKDKALAEDPEIKTWLEALAKKPAGNDPLMAAQVLLYNTKENRGSPPAELAAAVSKVLAAEQTLIADKGNLRSAALQDLFYKHGYHVWDNRAAIEAWADLWVPRLGNTTECWGLLLNRVREHGAVGTLAKAFPLFEVQMKAGLQPSEGIWANLTAIPPEKGATTLPLSPYYSRLSAWRSLHEQYFRHQGGLEPVQKLAEAERLLAAHPLPTWNWREADQHRQQMLDHLFHTCVSAKVKASPALLDLIQAFAMGEGQKNFNLRSRALEILLFHERSDALGQYLTGLKTLTPLEQIQLFTDTLVNQLPEEAKGEAPKPGHRLHTILTIFGPALKGVGPDAASRVLFSYGPFECLNRWAADAALDAQVATQVKEFLGEATRLILQGSPLALHPHNVLRTLHPLVLTALKEKDLATVSSLAMRMAAASLGDNNWPHMIGNHLRPLALSLEEAGATEVLVEFLRAVQQAKDLPADLSRELSLIRSRASRGIQGVYPVNPDHPAFPLYQAADALSENNQEKAWSLTRPRLGMLPGLWEELDKGYLAWCAEMMRQQMLDKESLLLCRLALSHEDLLRPETAALFYLTKADIARDKKDFPLAAREYESLRSNPRYRDTEAGRQARYRLVNLHILTNNYTAAEPLIERMRTHSEPRERAQAYYFSAQIAFQQEAYDEAWKMLAECFKFKYDHTEGRMLEGQLKYTTRKRIDDTVVIVGEEGEREKLIPGSQLLLQIQDRNRVAGGGGKTIPVVVTTSKGKDREVVRLLQSGSDPSVFKAFLPTRLGTVEPGNGQLELFGEEVVSYQIDPAFREARNLPAYPPHRLLVVDDARLVASAGRILTEEEEEKMALTQVFVHNEEKSLRERASRDTTVRPGSPLYLQVTDRDRNLTPEPDRVEVTIKTSSGDYIEAFPLLETGPTTGIFRATCTTGIPAPRATASDTELGKDVNVLINRNRLGEWTSLADGKQGKWLEIDTQSSHLFGAASLGLADAASVKKISLYGQLADEPILLASFPADGASVRGGCSVTFLPNRSEHELLRISRLLQRYVSQSDSVSLNQSTPVFSREGSPLQGRDGWMIARLQGQFYIEEALTLDFRFIHEVSPSNWQWAYLLIDEEPVLGGMINAETIKQSSARMLSPGLHTLTLYVRDHWSKSAAEVGIRQDDGSFKAIPADWFSVEANPKLAEALKPTAQISRTEEGFQASFADARRYRRLKWVFDSFQGSAVTVKGVTLFDQAKNQLIPADSDFSAALTNNSLEVAPGDRIEVSYTDELSTRTDKPVLSTILDASYYNGSIEIANEEVEERNGRMESIYLPARRLRVGDQLSIRILEFDADLTDQADALDVTLTTSTGERLEVKALEQPNIYHPEKIHTGIFLAVLKTGPATDPVKKILGVKPGDQISASYLDGENTDPGVPVVRTYRVGEAGSGTPRINVFRTRVEMAEDDGWQAKLTLSRMRRKGVDVSRLSILRKDIIAQDPLFNSKAAVETGSPVRICADAPLLFEVEYPSAALHQGSILELEVASRREVEAAKAEGREATWQKVPTVLRSLTRHAASKGYPIRLESAFRRTDGELLQSGIFSGVVRLQIGTSGDPVDDLVVGESSGQGFGSDADSGRKEKEGEVNRVPTLVVGGADTLVLRHVSAPGGEVTETTIQLVSLGRVELLDQTFTAQQPAIHMGEDFYLQVTDPDQDRSDDRDVIRIKASAEMSKDHLELELVETLVHSGVFTGKLTPVFAGEAPLAVVAAAPGTEAPVKDGPATVISTDDDILHVRFGDQVTFSYRDPVTLTPDKEEEVTSLGRIYYGANGSISAFTKQFSDPEMAVKVHFLRAEALFEMAKDLRALKKPDQAMVCIAEGRQILTEALRDYPNTGLKAQGDYLLANLSQELALDETDPEKKRGLYENAIVKYSTIFTTWPDSEYAARSQFKKAVCLERMGEMDQACEEHVKLTYTFPDHELVADSTIRLGNHYYKTKNYRIAGRVFRSFVQRHPQHSLAAKTLFLSAQCYLKQGATYAASANEPLRAKAREQYMEGIDTLEQLLEGYHDDVNVRAESMYWVGDTLVKLAENRKAYIAFKKLTFDYPESTWAKRARGYLTDERFARMEDD